MCKLNADASCVWNFNSSRLFQGKKYKFTFFVAVLYLKTSFKVNKSLNATTWPRNFLRAFPPRNTQVAQIHRMIYNILLPRRADTWFPSITPRECTDGPSTLTSYPNFLTHGAPLAGASRPRELHYDQTDKSLYRKQSTRRFLKMYKHWNFGQE